MFCLNTITNFKRLYKRNKLTFRLKKENISQDRNEISSACDPKHEFQYQREKYYTETKIRSSNQLPSEIWLILFGKMECFALFLCSLSNQKWV